MGKCSKNSPNAVVKCALDKNLFPLYCFHNIGFTSSTIIPLEAAIPVGLALLKYLKMQNVSINHISIPFAISKKGDSVE